MGSPSHGSDSSSNNNVSSGCDLTSPATILPYVYAETTPAAGAAFASFDANKTNQYLELKPVPESEAVMEVAYFSSTYFWRNYKNIRESNG